MLGISRSVNEAKGHISSLLALHFVILMKKIWKHMGGVWPHLKCKAPWEWERKRGRAEPKHWSVSISETPDIFGVRLKRVQWKNGELSSNLLTKRAIESPKCHTCSLSHSSFVITMTQQENQSGGQKCDTRSHLLSQVICNYTMKAAAVIGSTFRHLS